MKKIFLNTLLMLCLILTSASSLASLSVDQTYKSQQIDVGILSQYYKTTANFDSGGSQTDLLSGNSYQIIDVTPHLRWVAIADLGLRLGGNIGNAESSDALATRSNSTFNRIDVGVDYLLFNINDFEMILDFEYSHTLEKIETNTDSALSSNGANEIKPTILMRADLGGFYPYAHIGGNFRSEGLSNLLTYGGGGEFRFESMGIGAGVKGYSSISDDQYTNQSIQRDAVVSRVNAGSKKFYSINPNLLTAEGFLKFAMLENTVVKIFTEYDVSGSNTSQGLTFGGSIVVSFADVFSEKLERTQKNQPHRQNKLKQKTKFVEDTEDGVNQEYFKPVNPSNEEYIQPIEEKSNQEIQNETGSNVDPSVQQELDEMAYTIKLKKKKSKKQNNQ